MAVMRNKIPLLLCSFHLNRGDQKPPLLREVAESRGICYLEGEDRQPSDDGQVIIKNDKNPPLIPFTKGGLKEIIDIKKLSKRSK
jgi:hypothetical protein